MLSSEANRLPVPTLLGYQGTGELILATPTLPSCAPSLIFWTFSIPKMTTEILMEHYFGVMDNERLIGWRNFRHAGYRADMERKV